MLKLRHIILIARKDCHSTYWELMRVLSDVICGCLPQLPGPGHSFLAAGAQPRDLGSLLRLRDVSATFPFALAKLLQYQD